jgi:hypothetical protein
MSVVERVIHPAVVGHDGSDLAARLADVVARAVAAAFDDAADADDDDADDADPLPEA